MWIETSAEVFAVIRARHSKEICVHSSFTDTTGDGYDFSTGKPEILTEYGFKGSETPLLKILQKKQNKEQREWDSTFFIFTDKR